MALLWLPLDDVAIDAMSALARSQWGSGDLDATWRLTGWPVPRGGPPSRLVFGRREYVMDVGERRLALTMRFAPDLITGFMTSFAAFYDAAAPMTRTWPTFSGPRAPTRDGGPTRTPADRASTLSGPTAVSGWRTGWGYQT